MSCIVTDNPETLVTKEIRKNLVGIDTKTYEECFPFEEEIIMCYIQGSYEDCQSFIANKAKEIRDYLVIKQI